MPPDFSEIQRIAAAASGYYVRRLSWASTHGSDMQQEAILALLNAHQTFDPTKGKWPVYALAAARQAIRVYLWKFRSSVVPQRKERGGRPIEVLPEAAALVVPAPLVPASDLLDAKRITQRVNAVLKRLDYNRGKIGMKVLLDVATPAVLSKKYKIPPTRVYAAREHLMRRARRSPAMKNLYKEVRP